MEYLFSGSGLAVDVVYPTTGRARADAPTTGPTRDDLERLARGELSELILAGRYRLERRLGRGGMGSVYFGRHLALGRPVAIKVLDADEQDWSWAIARFMREARLAAKVRHRNIVDVYDFGSTPDGVVYIVMEMLHGRDLRAIVKCNRLNWSWTRYLVKQICAGVDAIHQVGVVHRDLKASNCFYVEHNSLVKVLDFGIATTESVGRERIDDGIRTIVGTPEYMAPEQIRGEPADRRSDVYAAGVLLCELLTGRTPFTGKTPEMVFDQQLHAPPATIAELAPDLRPPAGLDGVLARALAKEPRRRFQSMAELSTALDRVGEGSALRRLFGAGRASSLRPSQDGVFDKDAPTRRSRRPEAADPSTSRVGEQTAGTGIAST